MLASKFFAIAGLARTIMPKFLEASAIESALTNAFNTIKTDVTSYISAALPVALGIVGLVLAVTLGIKFFSKISHKS